MRERILTRLKELRGDADSGMEFAAGRSVEMICAYCGCEEMPEEMEGIGVALAELLLDSGGRAKSIKEGDISVTFREDGMGMENGELPQCFRTELDRYRRLSW